MDLRPLPLTLSMNCNQVIIIIRLVLWLKIEKTCVSLRVALWSQATNPSQLQIGDSRLKNEIVITLPTFWLPGGLDIEADDQLHRLRRQQRLQHLVVDAIVDNSPQSSRKNRSPSTRLGFGQLSVAKLGPNCLWDLAKRADPVPAKAPVESGEPDVQCLITFVNT